MKRVGKEGPMFWSVGKSDTRLLNFGLDHSNFDDPQWWGEKMIRFYIFCIPKGQSALFRTQGVGNRGKVALHCTDGPVTVALEDGLGKGLVLLAQKRGDFGGIGCGPLAGPGSLAANRTDRLVDHEKQGVLRHFRDHIVKQIVRCIIAGLVGCLERCLGGLGKILPRLIIRSHSCQTSQGGFDLQPDFHHILWADAQSQAFEPRGFGGGWRLYKGTLAATAKQDALRLELV